MKISFSTNAEGTTIKGIFEDENLEYFSGKYNEHLFENQVLNVGLGKKSEFTSEKARILAANSSKYLRKQNIKSFSIVPFNSELQAVTEGILLGLYQFLDFKTEKLDEIKKVDNVTIVGKDEDKELFDSTVKVCTIVNKMRDIQNTPSNVATPKWIAEKSKEFAKTHHLKATIWDKSDIIKHKMNGVMAVAKGSRNEPRFIILEYNPKKSKSHIALVGKGVTFDSGGISLKPGVAMDEMKFDMSGAATVLGSISAAAELNLNHKITAIMPCVENMPDGNSYKPGDVIKMMSGKTAEVLNTDAEGRMILADALHYATTLKPDKIVDFATLTGACVVALGHHHAGIFGTDEKTIQNITKSGLKTGEKVWHLPTTDEYKDDLKSEIADIKHMGDRWGGASTAASFLKTFTGDIPWTHIDIAGTAWVTKHKPYKPFGGTGFGVRLMVDWLKKY